MANQLQGSSTLATIGFEGGGYGIPDTTGFQVSFAPTSSASTTQAINSSSVISGSASPSQPFLGFKDGKVSFTVPVDNKAFSYWFKGFFGSPTTTNVGSGWAVSTAYALDDIVYTTTSTTLALKVTTAGTSDGTTEPDLSASSIGAVINDGTVAYVVIRRDYKHTYKIGTSIPSMFIEIEHEDATGGLFYMTKGIGLNTLSFSLGGDGELLATIEGIAKDTTKATSTAVTTLITDVTDGIKFGQFEATINGASNVKSFDLNYGNEIDADTYVIDGTGTRGGVPKGVASIGGSFTTLFEDDSIFASSRAFTDFPLDIIMTSNQNILKFDMEETKLDAVSNPEIAGAAGLIGSFNFQAYLSSGANNTALQVELTNGIATI